MDADLEKYLEDKKRKEIIAGAVKTIMAEVSHCTSGFVADAFYEALRRNHPTHQQGFWRMFVGVIGKYSENSMVDLRNRGAVDLCRELKKVSEEAYLPRV